MATALIDSSAGSSKATPEVIHHHKTQVFSSKLVEEKLEGFANYQLWRLTVTVTLRSMGLEFHLIADPLLIRSSEYSRWNQEDVRTFGQLLNSIDTSVKLLVTNRPTARDL
jgi:hypothetical protein